MSADVKLNSGHTDRPDGEVLASAYDALWKTDGRHSLDYKDLEAEVHLGTVVLRGHVRSGMDKREAEQRVAAVRGVKGLHSELVADSDLKIDVAQALAANQGTRGLILHVGASEGWIQLGGQVPDAQVRAEAEMVAAGVPAVRGVLGLPQSSAEPRQEGYRRAHQPRVGTTVYASDGEIGKVSGVVIDPHNRLVSHILVDGQLDLARREGREQFAIPAEAIRLTTSGGTTLHDSIKDVNARPKFREHDFPLAPPGWRPPFPYATGTVRWPGVVSS